MNNYENNSPVHDYLLTHIPTYKMIGVICVRTHAYIAPLCLIYTYVALAFTVYSNTCHCTNDPKFHTYPSISLHVLPNVYLTGYLNLVSDTHMSYLPQSLHFNISYSILLLVSGTQLSVLPKSNSDLEFELELPNYNDQEQRQYKNYRVHSRHNKSLQTDNTTKL